MKKRRSLNRAEQLSTLRSWMEKRKMGQREFSGFMASKGITISDQYLSDVLHGRKNPGPKFKEVFREITGINLVDGLIEDVSNG